MAVLRALGARSVPVVSRGSRYVFAQVIKDVVDFLGLSDDTQPQLSPSELAERYQDVVLNAAIRLCRQMPDDKLDNQLPNRPRSWLVLMHHLFQIPETFLDMDENGVQLTYESLTAPPPADMLTSEAVALFGEQTRERFTRWWQNAKSSDFAVEVEPYFGKTTRHEMLERTVWHSAQHTRQVASLLEQAGVQADRPLSSADIQGLPLTDKVWDES
ncbi:MAG: hypothetical protein ACI8W7_003097 [Gammaproteobacteria bacterium]|jgi:hypothetical protein